MRMGELKDDAGWDKGKEDGKQPRAQLDAYPQKLN